MEVAWSLLEAGSKVFLFFSLPMSCRSSFHSSRFHFLLASRFSRARWRTLARAGEDHRLDPALAINVRPARARDENRGEQNERKPDNGQKQDILDAVSVCLSFFHHYLFARNRFSPLPLSYSFADSAEDNMKSSRILAKDNKYEREQGLETTKDNSWNTS